jgi:hypothetical protein
MELRDTYISYLQCCSSEKKARMAASVTSIGEKMSRNFWRGNLLDVLVWLTETKEV